MSEIWDSEEQFRAFGERLFPLLKEAGVDVGDDPKLFEIHEIQRR